MTPRSYLLIAGVLAPFAVASAQVTPPPPVPPAQPTPVTAPTPRVAPVAPRPAREIPWVDEAWVREQAALAREQAALAREAVRIDHDLIRQQADLAREAARQAVSQIDVAHIAGQARLAAREAMDLHRFEVPSHNFDFKFDHNFDFKFDHNLDFNQKMFETSRAYLAMPSQRYQGDPADSAYRAARMFFDRQEYRAAATALSAMRTRFPNSEYFCQAVYYESFARYRIGAMDDLQNARRLLDGSASRCANRSDSRGFAALQARIVSALAERGDRDAIEEVRRNAASGKQPVCDDERNQVKAEALSSLMRMDPETGKETLKTALKNRDECSKSLRHNAIMLLSTRTTDADVVAILADVARNDPDPNVRYAAVERLGHINTDAAFAAIEEFLKSTGDERAQRAAVSAMGRNDNPRAHQALRALVDRNDVAENIRVSAINSLGQRERARTMGDYFRGLFGRVQSDELRNAVVNVLGSGLTEENQAFLLNIARDRNQASSVRTNALNRIRNSIPSADLYRIYETADSRSMRQSVVRGLAQKGDDEAINRLIDILKTSTDPEVRNEVSRQLGQPRFKDVPKVKQALLDLLKG
jgi:HEAT repeat protein/TolA-binding protein